MAIKNPYQAKWYAENRERACANMKRFNTRKQEWMNNFKSTLVCIKCGERRWWILDFHHRNPAEKEKGLNNMVRWRIEKIMAEIAKCDVLCSNCHRDLHYQIRNGDCNGLEKTFNEGDNVPSCSTKETGE